ncbi:13135_t:CDS:2, partial [Gigaspora margarita]
ETRVLAGKTGSITIQFEEGTGKINIKMHGVKMSNSSFEKEPNSYMALPVLLNTAILQSYMSAASLRYADRKPLANLKHQF